MGRRVLAIAGGVGGAKLALGLYRTLPSADLTVIVNTGDDDVFHGLHVSPDLDTVMYTVAGVSNREQGWGLEGETFRTMERLGVLGGETWFRLGDRDLATHLRRTELLASGLTLSQVTLELCSRLGVACTVAPMADEPVRTMVETDEGELAFQRYFVERRCEPRVKGVRFQGAECARPSPAFRESLDAADVLVFCPSNPFVSIGPVLAVPGVRDAIAGFRGTRVAVSPIIGGQAVRGPAAKMFAELGEEASCTAVALRYRGLCDVFVLDETDASSADAIEKLGMTAVVAPTLMVSEEDKARLARVVVEAA